MHFAIKLVYILKHNPLLPDLYLDKSFYLLIFPTLSEKLTLLPLTELLCKSVPMFQNLCYVNLLLDYNA